MVKAIFSNADLRGAYLWDADLREAYLGNADLEETHLNRDKLENAVLVDANLSRADVSEANLNGAILGDPLSFQLHEVRDRKGYAYNHDQNQYDSYAFFHNFPPLLYFVFRDEIAVIYRIPAKRIELPPVFVEPHYEEIKRTRDRNILNELAIEIEQ